MIILVLAVAATSAYCAAEEAASPIVVESEAVNPQAPAPESPAPEAAKYDFSDSSHWNLTVSAWERLAEKDFDGVNAYARKCIELYGEKALIESREMKAFLRFGHEDERAMVNDVATSHYIIGEALMKQAKDDEAIKEFSCVIENYPYAQCWDPKGWFWKVAQVSAKNIEKINKAKETVN